MGLFVACGPADSGSDATDAESDTADVESDATDTESDATDEESDAAATDEEPYQIAFFVKDASMPFWRYVIVGAQQEAEKLGAEVTEFAADAATNSAMQISQIEDAIESGVYDAFCVIAIDSQAVIPSLETADEAGIPVVLANTRVDDFENAVTFVGIDNYEAAKIVVEDLFKTMQEDGKTNAAMITNDPSSWVCNERIRPVHELADEYGINIVAEQPAYMRREEAMSVMENLLQGNEDIEAVWTMCDTMGMGAVQAIIDANRQDDIYVASFDGTPEAVLAVASGKLLSTLDQGPFDQGGLAVRAAIAALQGEEVEDFIACGGTLITIDNAQEFYDKYYADLE